MKRLLFILFLTLCCFAAVAQNNDEPKRMDFYGYVVTADSLRPIRNTHVISKMGHCGTISNRDGVFYIPARKVDTLWVSCLGYTRRLIPFENGNEFMGSAEELDEYAALSDAE